MVTLRTAITNLNNIRTQLTTSNECIITYKDLSLMRELNRYHPKEYFKYMDKHQKKCYLNYYNNASIKKKRRLKTSNKFWSDNEHELIF